jgi:hypothetical protein
MVEVDVFWSFALGAGFASAAARQIRGQDKDGGYKLLHDPYFTRNLIYLACLFAPSGIYLLWQFTGWETMYFWTGQVKTGLYHYERVLPAYLVVLFAITNVTQGILGYWWASVCVRQGKYFYAHLLWIAGYFCMFFILVHGWDGHGYVRFFTKDLAQWDSIYNPATGAVTHPFGLWMALKWAVTAPVAWTLYAMGVIMLPLLFYWISDWARSGFELGEVDEERAAATTGKALTSTVLRLVFAHALGAAIVFSILIHLIGFWIALLAFAVIAYGVWLRRGGLLHGEVGRITLEKA